MHIRAAAKQIAKRLPFLQTVRAKLNHREVLKRTAKLCSKPYYAQAIEEQQLLVTFISPFFQSFPTLVVSLLQQTYSNWRLLLIHDGPVGELSAATKEILVDARIELIETPERANDWGHTPRKIGFEILSEKGNGEFVVVSNSDNYHTPGYIRSLLEAFDPSVCATYCDMLHNYYHWKCFKTRLAYSYIDCGCIMARQSTALSAGWRENVYEADWVYVCDLVNVCGKDSFRKVPAPLFVHN